jgi:disulfide bond formation protein DsbB
MISSAAAALLSRFGALSGLSKILIVLGVAVVVAGTITGVYASWHHQVFRAGYDRAMLDIARADAKAIGRASDLRNTWRACRDADRAWDQTTGKCQ